MDRLIKVAFVLISSAFLAGNCNRNNSIEQVMCQICFGDKFIAKLYCEELSESSPSTYIKIYTYKNREVFKFQNADFTSVNIDSIKSDTLFLCRKVFSKSDYQAEQYTIIENNKVVVCCRDITLFGSSRGEGEKLSFLHRNMNTVYFQSQNKVIDSVSLKDLFFSGDRVSLIKYLDHNERKVLYFEHVNFSTPEDKKRFFESLKF